MSVGNKYLRKKEGFMLNIRRVILRKCWHNTFIVDGTVEKEIFCFIDPLLFALKYWQYSIDNL